MEEGESFDKFYSKLNDMVNSAFNLGETIPKPKIVRKVLRFLPEIPCHDYSNQGIKGY